MEHDDPVYNSLFRYTKALSAALGYRDASTQLHSERVLGLATLIGVHFGLSLPEMGILKISASFHDIGKIGIPDRILQKPGRFDETEWEIMRRHSEMGEKILLATEMVGAPAASLAMRHHHENFNGQGYPDRIAGEQISIVSRIICIADGYDAMSERRAYHRPKTHPEIMAILHHETGQKYDPALMQIFNALIEGSLFKAATPGAT